MPHYHVVADQCTPSGTGTSLWRDCVESNSIREELKLFSKSNSVNAYLPCSGFRHPKEWEVAFDPPIYGIKC